ncbi:hypothetical protein SAMN05216298_4294 [Glycomyces sambucus]|uniref:DUF308 domain-containing protein n=1 Tax=Glycomyces sambucus TaxID=380244 RepID=A0A1G9KXP3_9ACTN|nr:hypothetical protein [Glycomyces sambucus]SDL54273.1 hypothetical protein SAMN05216298_4294 [Glycomyces sambucus]
MPTEHTSGDRTVVADPAWVGPAFLAVLPIVGAGLGWGLILIAEWITGLSWFPFQGLFELVTDLPRAAQLTGGIALGAVAGFVLALWVVSEMLAVTVGRDSIRLKRGDLDRSLDRADIASVFVEDKRLVVLGHRRQELAQVPFDLDRDKLAAALRRHGYGWLPDGDPYGAELKRWVPGADGLPRGADALLKARDRALEKSNEGDLAELRDELAGLDVVVRDRDKKQYWRLADPA